jgi:hypothetical protein
MDKKYQIFISSTFLDLKNERKKVLDCILSTKGFIPAGMELFNASNEEQFNVIKNEINLSDIYLLILGKRYGTINDKRNISYTQMEYEYALSRKMPILIICETGKVGSKRISIFTGIIFRAVKCQKTLKEVPSAN